MNEKTGLSAKRQTAASDADGAGRQDSSTRRRKFDAGPQSRSAAAWLGTALLIGLACWLGIALTAQAGRVASVWIANGLLVALLLSVPTARWTGQVGAGLIGNVLANVLTGDSFGFAIGLSLCNTLEVLIIAGGMRRALGDRADLSTWQALRVFLTYGIVLGPVTSATVAAGLLAQFTPTSALTAFALWYPADALGIGIVTPLLLAAVHEGRMPNREDLLPWWPSTLALVLVTLGVFGQGTYAVAFLTLPPLLFMVFRHGHNGAVAGIALLSAISVTLTIRGTGPFAHPAELTLQDRVTLLQLFIAMSSAVALGVAMMLRRSQRLQERLQQAERDLLSITDNLPALIAHLDTDQRYRFVNACIGRDFGGDPQSMIGRSMREVSGDIVHEALAPRIAEVLAGRPVSFEACSEVGDRTCHYQSNYVPDLAETGEVRGFYMMTFDISARKEAELRQARSEKWLKAIADNIPALIAYIDLEQRYQFTNAHYRTVFAVDPASFIGKTMRELLGESAYAALAEPIARALAGEKVRFERHGTEFGLDLHFLVDYVPDRDAGGAVIGFFVSVMDITARKKAELRQAASEARLRTITDGLPGLIAYLDRSAKVRFCNATYEQWFGIPPPELISRSLDEALGNALLQPQGDFVRRALMGERNETEFEIEFQGVRRSLQATYLPHRDADGKVLGVYTLASDVTPIKRVQRQLLQLARYDSLTGLPNRSEFNLRLSSALARSERSGKPVALMFMDIDHFKTVNDRHGHAAGDEVLQEIAIRLQGGVRKSDTVARLAGDEFVIILENLNKPHEAQLVARKILLSIGRPINHHHLELVVGISIGIAFQSERCATPGDLLAAADRALYRAKAAGRNTYSIGGDPSDHPTDLVEP